MKEAPAPWHLHLPGAVRVQRACICSRINWSTKKLGGNAASCRHTSRLSWAAPSRVHSEAACSTGSFTCLLQYSGWAVQGQVCCCTSSHLVHLVKCHVCGGGRRFWEYISETASEVPALWGDYPSRLHPAPGMYGAEIITVSWRPQRMLNGVQAVIA